MPVNRFETPLVAQHQQTYVSQFVPLPFEQIQRKAEGEQKKYDENKAQWGKLAGTLGESLLTVDNPIMKDKVNSIYKNVDSQLETAGGDWRALTDTIQNAARDYKEFMTTGKGALGVLNKKAAEDYEKKTQDLKIGDYWAQLANLASHKKYEDNGALAKDQKWKGMSLWQPINYRDILIKDVLPKLISDEKIIDGAGYDIDEENGLVVVKNGKHEYVKSDRIKNAFTSELNARPEFNEMIENQYKILEELGYTGKITLDVYKKNTIDQLITGSKNFAYDKTSQSISTHARPGEEERVKNVLENAGANIEINTKARVTDKDLEKIQNIKQYKEQIDAMAYNPFSDMKAVFLKEGTKNGKTEAQWNSALQALASKSGIPINKGTADNYFKLEQQIVNGYITKKDLIASGVAGNESEASRLMASLQANYLQRKNYDRAFLEVAEGMVRTGNITQAEYDKLEKHFDTVYSNVDVRKKQRKDLYTFRGTADFDYDVVVKEDRKLAEIYYKLEQGGISDAIMHRVAHAKKAKSNVIFSNALPLFTVKSDGSAVPMTPEDSQIAWGKFFSTIGTKYKDTLLKMKFTAKDENKENYEVSFKDILEKEYIKDPMIASMQDNLDKIDGKTDPKSLRSRNELTTQIQARKDELYEQKVKQMLVMNAYATGTNNLVIGIPSTGGTTYTSELNPNKNNTIYSSIEQFIPIKTKNILKSNSKKMEASASPVYNYEAFPGVFISEYGVDKQEGTKTGDGNKVYVSRKEIIKKYPFLKQVESKIPKGTRGTDRIILEGDSGDTLLQILSENEQNDNKEDIEAIFTVFLQKLVDNKNQ